MNKLTPDNSDAEDWLTALLQHDAHRTVNHNNGDAAFVALVMARLEKQPTFSVPPHLKQTALTPMHWLLLGFELLVVVFLWTATPSAITAWLHIADNPMDQAAWHAPHVWGLAGSLAMLVYGAYELINLPEPTIANTPRTL